MISDLNGASSKSDFRSYLKERIRLFADNAVYKSMAEARIVSQITTLLESKVGLVGGFDSLQSEPSLSSFYSTTSRPLAFPKVDSTEMHFVSVENYSQ